MRRAHQLHILWLLFEQGLPVCLNLDIKKNRNKNKPKLQTEVVYILSGIVITQIFDKAKCLCCLLWWQARQVTSYTHTHTRVSKHLPARCWIWLNPQMVIQTCRCLVVPPPHGPPKHQWHSWNGSLHTCSYSDIRAQSLSSCPNRIHGNVVLEHWDVIHTVVCSLSKIYIHETVSKGCDHICKLLTVFGLQNWILHIIQSDRF